MKPTAIFIALTCVTANLGFAQTNAKPAKPREAPAKEINLPGVMKIEGEPVAALDFGRAKIVQLSNGGAESVYLSATEPNRIQLPFINPHIVGTSDVRIERRANSNNIYIAFQPGVKRAVPIFIETPDGSGPVLGLQLVPKELPAQTIIVEDVSPPLANAAKTKAEKSSEYIESVQDAMEAVVNNTTPQGYSIVKLNVPPIAMNGLLVEVDKKLSGRANDFYIYKVTNPGQRATIVKEEVFDGDLVLAVSIHPRSNLKPGDQTTVVVMAGKEKIKGR